ncbi:MAG: SRPBCC family protein [Actinomycetota bacterium]
MARYATTVRTSLPPSEAFVFVAELTNLPQWDPGVETSRQVRGDGPGPDAAYEVKLANPQSMTLTYETTSYDGEALSTTLVAKYSWFTSVDTVTATPSGDGADVTYDAELRLRGPLALGDLFLRPVFNKIGDKAARGLVKALDGEKVA